MTIEEIRALYDAEQRRDAPIPGWRREEENNVVRYVSDHDTHSMVQYSQLDESNVEQAIAEQVAYYTGLGHDFEWKTYAHDTPPDLVQRLEAHGFKADDLEAIVVLDLQELPANLAAPVTHDIRRITDPAGLDKLVAVKEETWRDDSSWLLDSLSWELRETPDLLSVYIAYADNQPAAAAWIRFDPRGRWAGLWGGSTLTQYRKRGIYTALVALRAQEALQRGVRFLTVDASPMSRPILEKLGFRQITTSMPLIWTTETEDE